MTTKSHQSFDDNSNIKKLIEARAYYYGTGKPIMTDEEYDALEDFERKKNPDHPFFETVGHPPSSAWEKANHSLSMGSLEKINTEEDFMKWASKFPEDTEFCLQLKLDGLSVSLDYEDSKFERGITRGDGTTGENISENVVLMRGCIKKPMGTEGLILTDMSERGYIDEMKPVEYPNIYFTGSVRAEIMLSKENFKKINSVLSEKDKYANPRNAAAGISRRLDGKFSKYLQLVAYDIDKALDEPEKLSALKSLGFYTPAQFVGDRKGIIAAYKEIKEKREGLPFDIDGVVVKAVSKELQKSMGSVKNRPKAQRAWKFDPPGAATTFLEDEWEVGRTGVVTPLAHLEPVVIDGSTIRKATLHNVAEIKRLGIGYGDTVMLVKRGDIIPKIESVLEHKGKPIKIPTKCPSCASTLENDGISLRCNHDGCVRKEFYRILNFINVAGIEDLGKSLAEELLGSGVLCSIADIFRLQKSDINYLDGWGDKSAEKIIDNIKKVRKMSPVKFLCALGIPTISESTSEELLKAFGTIDDLLVQTIDSIKELKGFSDISAKKIVDGLQKNKKEIQYLLTEITVSDEGSAGTLTNLSFCFTGAMENPRSFYQKIVTQKGGINKNSVVKDLSYLVCNEDKGSSKSRKAQKYEVPVITEKEFLILAGDIEPEPEEQEPEIKPLVEDCGSLFDDEE